MAMNATKAHRVAIIADLVARQTPDAVRPDECSEAVKDAVHALAEALLCDLKYDRDLFNDVLMAYGWTPDDVRFFGIGDLFDA